MKKTACMLAFLLVGSVLFSQDMGTVQDNQAEKRTVSSFHAIRVENGIDVYLMSDKEPALAVSASTSKLRDRIVSRVENGELHLYFDRSGSGFWKNRGLRAYISVTELQGLKASGGSDIIVKGTLSADSLNIQLSGGSDFVGEIRANKLEIDQSGGSDVRIKGLVVNLIMDASGGSDFKGAGLVTDFAIIRASGGSDVDIIVTRELYAEASGGSDIHYSGKPVIRKSSTGGGSSIRPVR